MRRLTLALAAILVAACSPAAVTAPSGGSGSVAPNRFGQTFIVPTRAPTPDTSVGPVDISTWLELAPIGLRFGVAFPGQPAATAGKVGDPPAPTTFWTYKDPSGRTFQIARTKLPKGALSDNPTTLLDKLDDTLFEAFDGGSFSTRTSVTTDGRPGIQYTIRSGNQRSSGLLVLDEGILYRVAMTYDVDRADDASLEAFLGSFTLFA